MCITLLSRRCSCTCAPKWYLCIVDYYSKFPVVHELKDNSADALVHAFEDIFCEYDRCREIISDAGSNFVSEHFQRFCSKIDIKHVTTSSYHHSSNGQVENSIKLIKQTYKKCSKTGKKPKLALLQIQTTPINYELPSPAEPLGICMRGLLPTLPDISDYQT